MGLFALSHVHLSVYEFHCFAGDGLPSGEEQYFSQFGDRHASVFMQSKAQLFLHLPPWRTGVHEVLQSVPHFVEDNGEGNDEAGAEQAVWVVEVKPVQAIMSTITIIVINIAL